jgi:hypothetical protein
VRHTANLLPEKVSPIVVLLLGAPADSQNPNIVASNWNITTGPPHFLPENVFAGASRCIHKPAPLGPAIIKTLVNTSDSLLKGHRICAADLSLSNPYILLTEIYTGRACHCHEIRLVPRPIGQLCITFSYAFLRVSVYKYSKRTTYMLSISVHSPQSTATNFGSVPLCPP